MRKPVSSIRRCQEGFAATEFAMIAPIMLVIFFAILEASAALGANRRVTVATNTLVDLISQETEISSGEVADLFDGMSQVVGLQASNANFTILSVEPSSDGNSAVVTWTRASTGTSDYNVGDTYTGPDANVVVNTGSPMMIVESELLYTPTFTASFIPKQKITKSASRLPRRSLSVTYCGNVCS